MTVDVDTDERPPASTLEAHWDELVAVAMLGTDRRNPPPAPGVIAELVDDTVRETPAERMLAQVAACVAVRRAGVVPAPPVAPLAGPPEDDRPAIPNVAVQRWYEVVARWPVLEDEWMLTVIGRGWRLAAELVPAVLERHRRDGVRRARSLVACGSRGPWLAAQLPALEGSTATRAELDAVGELPVLPIPAELSTLMAAGGDAPGAELARRIADGELVHAHRAVLVNVVARARPDTLPGLVAALTTLESDPRASALATPLADLAALRQAMLHDLDN